MGGFNIHKLVDCQDKVIKTPTCDKVQYHKNTFLFSFLLEKVLICVQLRHSSFINGRLVDKFF